MRKERGAVAALGKENAEVLNNVRASLFSAGAAATLPELQKANAGSPA